MIGKIVAGSVLMILLAAVAAGAQALTLEEAAAYILRDPAGAAQDIVDLDTIEAAVPSVASPDLVVLIDGRDVVVTWRGPIVVDVAGRLRYEITLNDARARRILPPPSAGTGIVIVWGLVAAAAGFFAGIVVAAIP